MRVFWYKLLLNSNCLLSCLFFSLQEHRTEIDARAGTFQAFEQFGQQLLARGHYASPEIQQKLEALDRERADLEKAWVQRRMMLDQCLELQVMTSLDMKQTVKDYISATEGCLSIHSFLTETVSRLRTGWQLVKPSSPVMTRVTPWTVWRPSLRNMKTLTRPSTFRSVRHFVAPWKLWKPTAITLFCLDH